MLGCIRNRTVDYEAVEQAKHCRVRSTELATLGEMRGRDNGDYHAEYRDSFRCDKVMERLESF